MKKQLISRGLVFGFTLFSTLHVFAQNEAEYGKQNVSISPQRELRSLKDAVGDHFKLGVGVSHRVVQDPEDASLIRRHFQILTPENCMKPQWIHPAENEWNFEAADRFGNFARSNKLELVGHCLVWAKDDRTAGMDFIVTAFNAARAQDPDALLIYNGYNGHKPGKREK